jgi:hypothetical protein
MAVASPTPFSAVAPIADQFLALIQFQSDSTEAVVADTKLWTGRVERSE